MNRAASLFSPADVAAIFDAVRTQGYSVVPVFLLAIQARRSARR
jgi:hypothetical protein